MCPNKGFPILSRKPGGSPAAGFLFLLFWVSVFLSGPVHAAELDQSYALENSQQAIGRTIGNHVFTNSNGETVQLTGLRDKPLVVSMIFTACSNTCPIITQTLKDAVAVARKAVGADEFRVITIGFDVVNDTPERMRGFARRQGIPLGDGWQVLSGNQAAVEALAEDIGFLSTPSIRGFDHLNQTTVIGTDGRVFRQIYGQTFESVYLVEPLKSLVFGTDAPFSSLDDLVNKVRLFCTIYDPNTDRYQFDYSMFYRFGVGLTVVIALLVVVVRGWRAANRRERQRNKKGRDAALGLR